MLGLNCSVLDYLEANCMAITSRGARGKSDYVEGILPTLILLILCLFQHQAFDLLPSVAVLSGVDYGEIASNFFKPSLGDYSRTPGGIVHLPTFLVRLDMPTSKKNAN